MISSTKRGGSRKAATSRPKGFGKAYFQPNPKPKPTLSALRKGELGRIMAARHGDGCDTDDAIIYLTEAAGLMQPHRLAKWAELRTPGIAPDIVWQIGMAGGPKQTGPDDVARRLNVKMSERTSLGIRTIGACDVSRAERLAMTKAKKLQAKQIQRWKSGSRPRHLSVKSVQPWRLFGRSKSWFYGQPENVRNELYFKALEQKWTNSAPSLPKEGGKQVPKQSSSKRRRKVERPSESERLSAAAGQGFTISETPVRGDGRFAAGEVCRSLPPPETTRAGGRGPPAPDRKTLTSPKVGSAILSKTYISLSASNVQPNVVGGAMDGDSSWTVVTLPGDAPEGAPVMERLQEDASGDGSALEPASPAPADHVDVAEYDEVPDFVVLDAGCGAETVEPDEAEALAFYRDMTPVGLDQDGEDPSPYSTPTDLAASPAPLGATGDDDALSEQAEEPPMTLNDLHHAANELPPDRRTRLYRLLHRSDAETPEALALILDIAANKPNLDDRTALEQISACGAHDDRGLPCPANRN